MTDTILLVSILVWWATGFCSFVYAWTKRHNATIGDVVVMAGAGLFAGPIAFLCLFVPWKRIVFWRREP